MSASMPRSRVTAEAAPCIAVLRVDLPLRPVRPMFAQVALALCEARTRHRGGVLARVQVDLRVRKVGQAACVIEIEVRDDDVAQIRGRKAERLDLRERGLRAIERRADEPAEHRRQLRAALDVARAEPGVDEHEPVARGFDQQTMRDHPAATQADTLPHQAPARSGTSWRS